jgi:hypothetical protein
MLVYWSCRVTQAQELLMENQLGASLFWKCPFCWWAVEDSNLRPTD